MVQNGFRQGSQGRAPAGNEQGSVTFPSGDPAEQVFAVPGKALASLARWTLATCLSIIIFLTGWSFKLGGFIAKSEQYVETLNTYKQDQRVEDRERDNDDKLRDQAIIRIAGDVSTLRDDVHELKDVILKKR
jgi:hypothetical protein